MAAIGYRLVQVDLSRRSSQVVEVGEATLRKYFGGSGLPPRFFSIGSIRPRIFFTPTWGCKNNIQPQLFMSLRDTINHEKTDLFGAEEAESADHIPQNDWISSNLKGRGENRFADMRSSLVRWLGIKGKDHKRILILCGFPEENGNDRRQ